VVRLFNVVWARICTLHEQIAIWLS